ncbi:MAG: hypothetical protein HRU43_00850 [Simkaniaceae bacterium]|nr:hypothetical protein [Simkaniaceae bacterium]
MSSSLYERLQALEKGLSDVRLTKGSKHFENLKTLEEVSLIKQAKREHHRVICSFSGKAFINLDDDVLFKAFDDQIIDYLVEDTPLLKGFLKQAFETFQCISSNYLERVQSFDPV